MDTGDAAWVMISAALVLFMTPGLEVRARPKKTDSAELYRDDEFLGVIYRDDEDGELSYNFSMAILDIDL